MEEYGRSQDDECEDQIARGCSINRPKSIRCWRESFSYDTLIWSAAVVEASPAPHGGWYVTYCVSVMSVVVFAVRVV
jgi:hypothetical protein